jgi:methyl coenzyme M reductase subunit C-like uncharacterized protein (methanogenesis marker protein 7)
MGMLPSEVTIAEYLKEEGYATSIVGSSRGTGPIFCRQIKALTSGLASPTYVRRLT